MCQNTKFYLILFYITNQFHHITAVKCFVSKINDINGTEMGMSKQKCPENTVCTLAEEISAPIHKRSKFRDCLNEKMCQLLELDCQFCYTDYCVPEFSNSSSSNFSKSTHVNCVQCNTRNDSYCLTRKGPVAPCSKGEVCVTFSFTNFQGKNELDRGCSNKEVCRHIGDFCSWCNTDACLPRMPRIMYLTNPRMSCGRRIEQSYVSVYLLNILMSGYGFFRYIKT